MPHPLPSAALSALVLCAAHAHVRAGGASTSDAFLLGWDHAGSAECLRCRLLVAGAHDSSAAPSELRFEPGTGRDKRNFAPDRPADLLHMKVEMNIEDMNNPSLTAVQTLTFAPIGRPLDVLRLNAEQMEIESVCLVGPDGSRRGVASTSYDDHELTIRFDPPIAVGEQATIQVDYALHDPAQGLTWTTESPEWPGRPAQIHTQGQPETNRFWFPAHDFPNERLTTEFVVTVPEGYVVSSNGKLVSEETKDGRSTFHWLQDRDHVSYLVSLIVGKFDIVDVAPEGSELKMPVYVPPGKGGQVRQTYGRTPEMLKVFERRFDEPYPWARYAQLVVWNFGAGGMENTSATTMFDTAVLDETALLDGDLDGLISHELAHQWFGDLITCNTWAHIWLNEGWATYSTALWYEARDGYDDGYLYSVYNSLRGVAKADQFKPGDTSFRPAMVSPVYEHPWETFRRTSNPYPKGCSILHMLRMKLGEDLFFRAVGVYVDRYKFRTAETDDFRQVLEEVSGQSLEKFFTQWCYRPGTPKLHVKAEWDEELRELHIVAEQMQRIDAELPAFEFDLPIIIETSTGSHSIIIPVNAQRHERSVALDEDPRMVLVDPQLTVLADLTVQQPARRFIAQLEGGPTVPSRLDAAAALSSFAGRPGVVDALRDCLAAKGEHHAVRSRAAESLGKLAATDALLACLGAGIDDARVRASAIRALESSQGDAALTLLAKHASGSEPSYACRAAAIEALGKLGDASSLPLIEQALEVDSQHDQVRQAALRALRELDKAECLAAAIPFTRFGVFSRTRPVAIDAVANLAHHDKARAYDAVAPLLSDPEDRTVRAAIEALVKIEDERGVQALEIAASATRNAEVRRAAESARDRLRSALDRSDSMTSTRAEIERLSRELEQLRQKVEEQKSE